MRLGLVGNLTKELLKSVIPDYVAWLREQGIEYLVSDHFREVLESKDEPYLPPEEIAKKADIVLSFGGDGTLLNTVNLLQGRETPVLGVNLGGLGYLTEAGADDIRPLTLDLLENRWAIERRMVLEVRIENEKEAGPWYALNDVVIDKGGFPRMIRIRTTIDGKFLNIYRADGLLLATPTGSTGYSLSAGGPIVEPKLDAIIVHPLNPHSLSNRPLIISHDKAIRVEAETPYDHVTLAVDGQTAYTLSNNHTVIIRRADFSACLVTFKNRYFYEVLRQKLGWGDA
ncbi:NAD(+)/NADH kinase [bacterium]|nr:NAD(+)/NADH kinase [bacterium]